MDASTRRKRTGSNYRILLTSLLGLLSLVAALTSLGNVVTVHTSLTDDADLAMSPTIDGAVPSRKLALDDFIRSSRKKVECPEGLVPVYDRPSASTFAKGDDSSLIPHVIHQTSRSPCLVPALIDPVQKWKERLPDFSYYFHDDEAVLRLLTRPSLQQTFPLLREIALHCTRGAMRADLWRYIILWEYGGIYSDVDTFPTSNFTFPSNNASAFFVLESDGLLSQYFIAIAPRHPLMFYTIQHTLQNLWKSPDPIKAFAPTTTGPRALHQGFQTFCGSHYKIPDSTGQWLGLFKPLTTGGEYTVDNYTVVVEGSSLGDTDSIIQRDAIPRETKKLLFRQMNMTYFMQDARLAPPGQSCMAMVYNSLRKQKRV